MSGKASTNWIYKDSTMPYQSSSKDIVLRDVWVLFYSVFSKEVLSSNEYTLYLSFAIIFIIFIE